MKYKSSTRITSFVKFAKNNWQTIVVVLPVFIGTILFLSRIPGSAAEAEHTTAQLSASLKNVFDNPINAPYKLVAFFATLLSPSVLAVRSVSILFFFLSILALYYTLRHWHSNRAAGLATAAFAANSIALAVGRLGTELVMIMGWFIFTGMLLWQVHGKSNKIVPNLVLVALAVLLYTPGAPWFFFVFLFFYWDRFRKAFVNVKNRHLIIGVIALIALLAPLVIAFTKNPNTAIEWLLLPQSFDITNLYKSALQVPSAYIYKMSLNPLINVSSLPVFDLASGFLFLIGIYAYSKKLRLDRTRLMIAVSLVGLIVGALGQVMVAVIMLLPFAFSVIAAGIEYLLDEWNGIFPKNPFARSFGLLVITTVVLFGMYYQLTRFLVVWPQAVETRNTYNQSRIIE